MIKNKNQFIVILTIALIVGVISIFHVLIGYAKTSPGSVYLWTGHYYLDYFVYLQAVAQGMWGHWLVNNPFATDDPTKTLLVWGPYILLGKIASLLHLSAIAAYWLSVFFLSIAIVFATYILISKLLPRESFLIKTGALLFSLLATPFVLVTKASDGINISPYDFWYAPSTILRRFESVPHHLLGNLLVLILLILAANIFENISGFKPSQIIKRAILISIIFIFALSFYPYNIATLFLALGCCGGIYFLSAIRKKLKNSIVKLFIFFAILGFLVIPFALIIKYSSTQSGVIERIGKKDLLLSSIPGLSLIVLSLGPLLTLSLLGIKDFLNKFSYSKLLMIFFIVLSYLFSFTKLSSLFNNFNLRFQTPVIYLFLGVLGILGVRKVASISSKFKNKFAVGLFSLLILYFVIISGYSFKSMLNDTNIFSPITYLPEGIINGFKKLEKLPKKGNVLVTPSQILGAVLPIYTDKKTYVARPDFTPNYIEKNIMTSNFYIGAMTNDQALKFLKKNNIAFVVLTSIEGYDSAPLYHYPFLKGVYKNENIIIFQVV